MLFISQQEKIIKTKPFDTENYQNQIFGDSRLVKS